LNTVKVLNREAFEASVRSRKALVTVSNHYSCLDDPLLWGALLSWSDVLMDPFILRWSMAAHDVVFTNSVYQTCVPLGSRFTHAPSPVPLSLSLAGYTDRGS
jgi:Acyltransferase